MSKLKEKLLALERENSTFQNNTFSAFSFFTGPPGSECAPSRPEINADPCGSGCGSTTLVLMTGANIEAELKSICSIDMTLNYSRTF